MRITGGFYWVDALLPSKNLHLSSKVLGSQPNWDNNGKIGWLNNESSTAAGMADHG